MNIWSTWCSALRGGMSDASETLADSQALRILDQEVRDVDQALRSAKESLAQVMARQAVLAERVQASAVGIAEHEARAIKALHAGNQTLALQVAERIAQLEAERQTEQAQAQGFTAHIEQLRKVVNQLETKLHAAAVFQGRQRSGSVLARLQDQSQA